MVEPQTAASFKAAVAADLYSATDVVDFEAAKAALTRLEPAFEPISRFAAQGPYTLESLTSLLIEVPRAYEIICALLSITGDIEFADGRKLPSPSLPPRTEVEALEVSEILVDLGIFQILTPALDVGHMLLVLHITRDDAARRRQRVEASVKGQVQQLAESAVLEANGGSAHNFSLAGSELAPPSIRRLTEHVITVDGVPRIVIATTFQTYSGGRQSSDFRSIYPAMQRSLATDGLSLILIADGQGMKRIPDTIVSEVLRSIPHLFTLSQAASGYLRSAIEDLAQAPAPTIDSAGLTQIIEATLNTSAEVLAASLPVADAPARLALANYVSSHKGMALELRSSGSILSWTRPETVQLIRSLRRSFVPEGAIVAWQNLISAIVRDPPDGIDAFRSRVVETSEDGGLTSQFVLGASGEPLSTILVRQFAVRAMQLAPTSRLAVLAVSQTPSETLSGEIRRIQATLPVTVIVLDLALAQRLAQSSDDAGEAFRSTILTQSDLTKMSPFVVRSVTPDRVFFGREEEEATLLRTVMTNSVALLGGRRIGKTSLLQHSVEKLRESELQPYFLDCQVVKDWADFGKLANSRWDVDVPLAFKPQHLFDLVEQLGSRSDRPIVILLDEVDQMLYWDMTHVTDEVPEAFFRACRALSQENRAQFVFAGERTIAQRIWDPSSPHWNFCRPLQLQQLTTSAGRALIAEPLEQMGVRIDDKETFVQAAWNCTDGHPELLQFLGDHLVTVINKRDRRDVHVTPKDVQDSASRFGFAEQYVETYWGQANALERLITVYLAQETLSFSDLLTKLEAVGLTSAKDASMALHMLTLYGIIDQADDGYVLRASWFRTALTFFGGVEDSASRYLAEIKT